LWHGDHIFKFSGIVPNLLLGLGIITFVGVKGQVWGSILTDNNLSCEVEGHLGQEVEVYWAADLTLTLLGWARRCHKKVHFFGTTGSIF